MSHVDERERRHRHLANQRDRDDAALSRCVSRARRVSCRASAAAVCGRSGGRRRTSRWRRAAFRRPSRRSRAAGPSATTVAPINAKIGTATTLPTTNAASTSGTRHGLPAKRSMPATTRSAEVAETDARAAHSRTTASNDERGGAEQREPHFTSGRGSRRPVAWATSSLGGHDALGIAELHDEVDAGRFVALDRLDDAECRRARGPAPRREPRMLGAVGRAEDGHARQRARALRNRLAPTRALRRRFSRRCPSARRSSDCAPTRCCAAAPRSPLRWRCRTRCRSPSSGCSSSTSRCARTVSSTTSTFACTWIDSVPSGAIFAVSSVRGRSSAPAARRTECGLASDGVVELPP